MLLFGLICLFTLLPLFLAGCCFAAGRADEQSEALAVRLGLGQGGTSNPTPEQPAKRAASMPDAEPVTAAGVPFMARKRPTAEIETRLDERACG
jgi:hypothetical protein